MTRARALPTLLPGPLAGGRRGAILVALAWLLLLTQTLGVLHRTVHSGIPTQLTASSSSPASDAPRSVLGPLFGHTDNGSSACQLYDQLSHADALTATACEAVHAVPTYVAEEPIRIVLLARAATGFLARAPPAQG